MLVIYNSLILNNKTYKTSKTRNTGYSFMQNTKQKNTMWVLYGYHMVSRCGRTLHRTNRHEIYKDFSLYEAKALEISI